MSTHSENVKKMIVWALEAFGGPHARTIPIEAIDAMVERSESSADFLIEIRDRLPSDGAATEATLNTIKTSLQSTLDIKQDRKLVGTANITSASSNAIIPLPANTMAVAVVVSGTYAGVTFAADLSEDGVLFDTGIRGFNNQTGAAAVAFTPGTNGTKRYVFPVNCAAYIKLRATAWTSGTANLAIYALPAIAKNNDNPATSAVTQSGAWTVGNIPATSGGLTRHRLVSAASTNATLIKSGVGQIYTIHGHNSAGSHRYLKLYTKASAPDVGTDTPVETYLLPAGQPFRFDFSAYGNTFVTGIAYAITGALPDNDTTPIGAGEVLMVAHFK